jgi:hypothetical protein
MPMEVGPKLVLMEFIPIFRFYYKSIVKRVKDVITDFTNNVTELFTSHYDDYDQNYLRDFSDQLIFAKNEAISENKDSAKYMTDANLGHVIMDIFMGNFNSVV